MTADKKSIVASFLEKGKLLTPDALEHIYSKGDTAVDAPGLLVSVDGVQTDEIRILKNLASKPAEIRTEDFIRFYASKYEKMKNVIASRAQKNFISLNKLDASRSEVYVLGIVKDVKEKDGKKTIELEDLTTSVPVVFDEANVELDEVVAVRAVSAGRILYGKEIIHPDIPIRSPAKGHGKACFVSDLHLEQSPKQDIENFFRWFGTRDIKYLFIAGDVGEKAALEVYVNEYCRDKKIFVVPGEADGDKEYPQLAEEYSSKNIISLSNPSLVEINGVKILLIHNFNLDMLKKRYLGKSKAILTEDYLVLEEVPDIVHCGNTHEPFISNYKSVTIVNSGSPLSEFRPVIVDFATRDVEQIRLPE